MTAGDLFWQINWALDILFLNSFESNLINYNFPIKIRRIGWFDTISNYMISKWIKIQTSPNTDKASKFGTKGLEDGKTLYFKKENVHPYTSL